MSRKSQSPGPVPPGNNQQRETPYEQSDQDESGKTDAPKSESGKEILRREGMADNDKATSKDAK
jgi:hypothetical protein